MPDEPDEPDEAAGRFVGVGVADYDSALLGDLPKAGTDVSAVREALPTFAAALAGPTDEISLRGFLKTLKTTLPGSGPLVVLWSGHGVLSPNGGLRLLCSDSADFDLDGIEVGALLAACGTLGASQILVVVDTCHSAKGVVSAVEVLGALTKARPPDADELWVGFLASAQPEENARDGELGSLLVRLLTTGPTQPAALLHWQGSEWLTGHDLGDSVLKEWTSDAHRPEFLALGSVWHLLPSPLRHRPGHPPPGPFTGLVSQLVAVAADSEPTGEEEQLPPLTGRQQETALLADRMQRGQPGLVVVTGAPGAGKSALLARLVAATRPEVRRRLAGAGDPKATLAGALGHADPGYRTVAAYVRARGLTADRMAEQVADQLVLAGVIPPSPTGKPRNAALLVGELQQADLAVPPVVVVDGLDEARTQAFPVATELLQRLAPLATVVVGTRELPGPPATPSLLSLLDPGGARLDLSDPSAYARTEADLRAYVVGRLRGAYGAAQAHQVADVLLSVMKERSFLLARVGTDALLTTSLDLSAPGWQKRIAGSLVEAMTQDMDRLPWPQRPLPDGVQPADVAAQLLRALTYGFGAGLPLEEWAVVAATLGPVPDLTPADAVWALDTAGQYVVQDLDHGTAVYRLAHQSVADILRVPFVPTVGVPFDESVLPVTSALLDRYADLLRAGVPPAAPSYLWYAAWRHAAAAGPAGLDLFQPLTDRQPRLLADLAMAHLEVVGRLATWGHHERAVPFSEQAVELLRRAVQRHDVGYGERLLADALATLSIVDAQTGRTTAAIAAAEEALERYTRLAEADPAYASNVAGTMANLASWRVLTGDLDAAVAGAAEAVERFEALAGLNPSERSGLVRALSSQAAALSGANRYEEALAGATRSVALARELLLTDRGFLPWLAGALRDLAGLQVQMGDFRLAEGNAEAAADDLRELARDNPLHLTSLGIALSNQATALGELGEFGRAEQVAAEAVHALRRAVAEAPANRWALVRALNLRCLLLANAGHPQEALDGIDEAVDLARADLAAPSLGWVRAVNTLAGCLASQGMRRYEVRDLDGAIEALGAAVEQFDLILAADPSAASQRATALNARGQALILAERSSEAQPMLEEALRVLRVEAAARPGLRADLARALTNLAVCETTLGEPSAGEPADEAIDLLRTLVADQPTAGAELARALRVRSLTVSPDLAPGLLTESADRYRAVAGDNPLMAEDLTRTLQLLAAAQDELDRPAESALAWQEAADVLRGRGGARPESDQELPGVLVGLARARLALGDTPAAAEAATSAVELIQAGKAPPPGAPTLTDPPSVLLGRALEVLALADPGAEARLGPALMDALSPADRAAALLERCALVPAGDPRAVPWLARTLLASDALDRPLRASLGTQVRRHAAVPAFREALETSYGALPAFATLDQADVDLAAAWADAPTYTAERDLLLADGRLLDPTLDDAVEEALLAQAADSVDAFRARRAAAVDNGPQVAYAELVAFELAEHFADADPAQQADLLAARRADLLAPEVAEHLRALEAAGDVRAQTALPLVLLAAAGQDGLALAAGADPAESADLLRATVVEHPDSLLDLANYLGSRAEERGDTDGLALALLYAAVALTGGGDPADLEQARDLVASAYRTSPAQRPAWLALLDGLLPTTPSVAALIVPLATATEQA